MTQLTDQVEKQIAQWRAFLRRRRAVEGPDVEEMEGHLRDRIAELVDSGLAPDEALLVAVKRMGSLDEISREFAREHSERLWKQLVVTPSAGESGRRARTEALVVLALAVGAALAIKVPELFGFHFGNGVVVRNISLLVLPLLTGYFVWKRRLSVRLGLWLAAAFAGAAVAANIFPFVEEGDTEVLVAMHLPIAMWLVVGVAYAGGRWFAGNLRMDFVRFSGELLIYFALIALGGFVLIGLTAMIFESIGLDAEWVVGNWLVPCGAMGGVIVASWLVEIKQSVIENMAPVLTRLFTPLFTVALLVFLGAMVWTGNPIDVNRNVLIAFDLLLVLVVGLLLYNISARDPEAPPGPFDVLLLLLVVSALAVDIMALTAIAARITEFGFTPNRVAALGENIILLVNLAWSAYLYARFLRSGVAFSALERWQTAYLPVYSVWAALVVVSFPPIFGFD